MYRANLRSSNRYTKSNLTIVFVITQSQYQIFFTTKSDRGQPLGRKREKVIKCGFTRSIGATMPFEASFESSQNSLTRQHHGATRWCTLGAKNTKTTIFSYMVLVRCEIRRQIVLHHTPPCLNTMVVLNLHLYLYLLSYEKLYHNLQKKLSSC